MSLRAPPRLIVHPPLLLPYSDSRRRDERVASEWFSVVRVACSRMRTMETVSKGNQPTRYQTWATAASCPLHGLACACGNRTGQQPPWPKTREPADGSL